MLAAFLSLNILRCLFIGEKFDINNSDLTGSASTSEKYVKSYLAKLNREYLTVISMAVENKNNPVFAQHECQILDLATNQKRLRSQI